MATLKVHNKKYDVTYVFENQPYWDKEKKQSRTKRKLIGKIDPATGEVVPTGKRGRPRSPAEKDHGRDAGKDGSAALLELERAKERVRALEKELSAANRSIRKYESALKSLLGNMRDRCEFIGATLDAERDPPDT